MRPLAMHAWFKNMPLLFVFVHANNSQLGSYIHACRNEVYSLVNLQDLIPTLPGIIIGYTN